MKRFTYIIKLYSILLLSFLLFVGITSVEIRNDEKKKEKKNEFKSHHNGNDDMVTVVAASVKEEHDYKSAVGDILFVEEFSGLGRIVGTCKISINGRLQYNAKISKMACIQACEGGKDPRIVHQIMY